MFEKFFKANACAFAEQALNIIAIKALHKSKIYGHSITGYMGKTYDPMLNYLFGVPSTDVLAIMRVAP